MSTLHSPATKDAESSRGSDSFTRHSTLDAANPPIAILGVPFDNVTTEQAIQLIEEMITSRRPHYLVTANVDFLVQAQADVELRRILFDAHLVLCDGTPLLWASRFLGNPLPERVAGADLVPLLIRRAAQRKYRLFFLGATPESSERAVANLQQQYPGVIISGHYSPPFNKLLEMDHEEIKRRILAAQPDLLFVSFGCPKQEKWIAMHYQTLGVPVAAGVGATIDFLGGQVKRAPAWMQCSGTEWIFRLAQEPRRLFGRYAKDLWVFGRSILSQWWQLKARSARRRQGGGSRDKGSLSRHSTLDPVHSSFGEGLQCVNLPQRLDLAAARDGALPVEQILSDGRDCLLQMANVEFIDSTGIGLLIQLQKKLRAGGRQLILVAPSLAVQRALKLMHLEEFFSAASDMNTAGQILQTRALELPDGVKLDTSAPAQIIRWLGEITAANAEEVWDVTSEFLISAAEASQPEVNIDLTRVRFIDSSGLGVMVRAKKLAQRHGTKLVFSGLTSPVRNVLQLARLEEFLLGYTRR
jgi:N-acetylglucosaminyldiphosphoundecaprenol N-acetyl-beta-D-mannosaminyltransferase